MEYAIVVQELTKRYEDVTAVDHISFEVKEGEIFGFLGPNGAGKTTTIRILTGLIKPDEGRAFVAGYDVLKNPIEAKQCVGIVPEVSNAYVDLTAWENLILIGKLYGVPSQRLKENAANLLKEFRLYEVKDKLVRTFSKGMKQRLLLCMALVNDPKVLFLDEPTSGLDVESARLLREKIVQYNKDGKTVFLSTHNMEEANQLCHRIAIINHGRIAAIDTPESLRAQSMELQYIEVAFNKIVNTLEFSENPSITKAVLAGNKVRIYTAEPSIVIEFLVEYAKRNNLRILSLNTMMPSLEDVFLKLIRGKEVVTQ
ncbi:MAG: ATP-binding cassette domain-containing protein [Thaumarchaeota archaeon]|jgi:ABC-2 type transport system ATP-binding protein|nr:ATP-binding cassette domain-containing protein [Candidatus Geocrenenecus arthurdayi]MCL7388656.1 ATP-binding cassette domain-containing protein [Candidatus Geocrenenecus arthurdayi]MCL7391368.1 ATP-binding cassette domain-containing protein [Candidatus Geocrenenecus arthurdayi]MCL7396230.1 ATP-binding cassette domain-containing protein [Candidatus Geocrenenecus arthurdayi]MCL7403518.1 ATP-binding cassette domain-containing protein [Candidatus Geocrenenecus arthurdayi]